MEIIWKPVPEWEGLYEASNVGLIKSIERPFFIKTNKMLTTTCILKPHMDKDCYLHLSLCKNGKEYDYKVHQLIAKTFIPNPENKPIPDHINGVRWDNRVENLRWTTQSENIQAAFDYGRKIVPSKPINKLTLDGEFIKRYEAIKHVEEDGHKSKSVYSALRRSGKVYGFKWEYA